MAKIEELIENEKFIEKLEKCDSEESAKALWSEYNIEKTEAKNAEFTEDELKDVVGGVKLNLSGLNWAIKNAKNVWKYSVDFGVICRAYYDLQRYGRADKSYSADRIFKAAKRLGLE